MFFSIGIIKCVVSSTGIFSYTSTRVLGIKSPSSPIYVGGSGTRRFLFIFKVYESVIIDTNAHDSINWLHLVVMVLKIEFFFSSRKKAVSREIEVMNPLTILFWRWNELPRVLAVASH